jgi:hypothetical protein
MTDILGSSCLLRAGYRDHELHIELCDGSRYAYSTPPETLDAMLAAPSAGVFYNTFIRDVYPVRRIAS